MRIKNAIKLAGFWGVTIERYEHVDGVYNVVDNGTVITMGVEVYSAQQLWKCIRRYKREHDGRTTKIHQQSPRIGYQSDVETETQRTTDCGRGNVMDD